MLVRPLMTKFKMTVRASCAVSACGPLPPPIKALAHWLSVGRVGLWIGFRPPPLPTWLQASEIKQTFLSTNLASLLDFEQQAARPRFWLQVPRGHLKENIFCPAMQNAAMAVDID